MVLSKNVGGVRSFDDDESFADDDVSENQILLVETALMTSNQRPDTKKRRSSDSFDKPGCGLHWSFNMILHGISIAFTLFVLYKTIPGYFFFSIHPICMTIGYGLLMFEAILFFSSWPITGASKKATRVTLHWILQVLMLILCAIGFIVVYYNKYRFGKNHFTTWHSWIGLLTIIATGFIALGGVFAKYPSILKKYQRPVILKSIHAFAGCLTFGLACLSLVTGLNSNYFIKLTKDTLPIWQFAYVVPAVMALAILLQVLKSVLPRFRSK